LTCHRPFAGTGGTRFLLLREKLRTVGTVASSKENPALKKENPALKIEGFGFLILAYTGNFSITERMTAMKLLGRNNPELKQVVELAEKKHWGIRVLGEGSIPETPIFREGWWYEPLSEECVIHPLAVQRVQEIYQAGIRPKGFIVAHQTLPILGGPKPKVNVTVVDDCWPKFDPQPKVEIRKGKVQTKVQTECLPDLMPALQVIGQVVGVALQVLGVVLMVIVGALSTISLDPALIMVLEDGTQVEVARWYNE
jgi:hypothetical protein